MRTPRRGELYLLKSDAVGKARPVLIMSRTELNKGSYCLVVPLYSSQFENRKHLRTCVVFQAGEFGLACDCVAKTDEVTQHKLVDIRLGNGPLGIVPADRMQLVSDAVGYSLGIND